MVNLIAGIFLNHRQRRTLYGLALALLLGVTLILTMVSWQHAVQRHDRELKVMASMGANAVDTYFVTLEKSLSLMGDDLRAAGSASQMAPILQDYKKRFPELQILAVTQPDGRVVAHSDALKSQTQADVSREPTFLEAMERFRQGDRMVIGRPFKGPVSQKVLTHLRYAVRDARGQLLFMLVVGLSQSQTHDFWKDAPLPPLAAMGLARDDGFTVARYPPLPQTDATSLQPARGVLPTYLQDHGHPRAGLVRGKALNSGLQTTYVFQRLQHYPLTFFVLNPEQNLRADWWLSIWPAYVLLWTLFIGGMGLLRWISQRQGAWEAERSSNHRQLQQAHAELAEFNYTLSHDLRAPIRAMQAYASLLQEGGHSASSSQALLDKIRQSAKRMWELLDDLMLLSRDSQQPLHLTTVDMWNTVITVVDDLGSESPHVKFEIGELPPAHADAVLMRQVWSNLISNALKFSAPTPEPVIRIGHEQGAYFVEDNGVGFDMAHQGRLFRLFGRLHAERDYPGNGVGLVMVRRIVERHGGLVRGVGQLGQGARFSFTLMS